MKTITTTSYGNMKLKSDADNVVVYYDKVNKWLFVSCANQVNFEEIRSGFEECLELIEENQCKRMIVDSYAIKYSPQLPEINRWLVNEWLPLARQQGLRSIAQLIPPELEQRLFETVPTVPVRPVIKIELFGSLVNAVKWLYVQG